MESASTSEIILDLITAAEQLPATAGPDVSKIQHLLKQLFVAATTDRTSMRNWVKEAKTERDCALEQLKTVQAEREDASKQLVEVRQKLEAAKDETERLRAEVTHFERMAVAAQKTARSGMNGAARDQGGEQNGYGAAARGEETGAGLPKAPTGPRNGSTASQVSQSTMPHPRSETIDDPRRPSNASYRTAARSARQVPPPAPGSDSYRPGSVTSTTPTPSKRKQTSTSPARNQKKPQRATPVCGTCSKHSASHACDGAVLCRRCETLGNRNCVYHLCLDGAECRRAGCDYLHPDQWDKVEEKGRRMVRDREFKRGEMVSGIGGR